jgi:uncharacterized protein
MSGTNRPVGLRCSTLQTDGRQRQVHTCAPWEIQIMILRKSHYTVVVDTGDGDALVMNQPRAAVDLMPLEYARMLETGDASAPRELIDYATRTGYLTTMTPEEEETWFVAKVNELEGARSEMQSAPLFSFVTTYSCNLACSYCFQANTGIRSAPQRQMTMEVARECLEVVRAAPEHAQRAVVELFGGEPLLPNLRDVVELIVLECESMGYVTRVTTNGTHLDAFADLLGPTRIAELQISLDGTAEFHDRRRIPISGRPTFETIWGNIQLALSQGSRVMIRANLDRRNLAGFVELAEFLDEAGFLDHPNGALHYINVQPDPIAPDYGLDTRVPLAEIEQYLQAEAQQHPVLRKVAAPHEVGTFEEWLTRNFHHPATRHCGAVTNNVFFAPDRRIYSCHETAGREEMSIGLIENGQAVENPTATQWRSRRVDQLPGCRRCPYALTCAGGCAARIDIESVPTASYCNGFDKTFKSLIVRQYHASESRAVDPEPSDHTEGG